MNNTPDRVLLDQATVDVITMGEIAVTGRLTDASNLTLLGEATLDGLTVPCIYKPVRGERPLWDFPDGTLADRELAAYLVSRSAGWDCVPLTVIRDGPYGPGHGAALDRGRRPRGGRRPGPGRARSRPGWLPVLRAVDTHGDDVAVVHADNPALALLAGFDLVVNNADRKGSHVLPTADGRILGVDHGLCFHTDDKLRTILWGWAGRPLPAAVIDGHRPVAGCAGRRPRRTTRRTDHHRRNARAAAPAQDPGRDQEVSAGPRPPHADPMAAAMSEPR